MGKIIRFDTFRKMFDLEDQKDLIDSQLPEVEQGKNLLIVTGNCLSLLKYKGNESRIKSAGNYRELGCVFPTSLLINFIFSPEFETFFPSSSREEVYIPFALETPGKGILFHKGIPTIVAKEEEIKRYLMERLDECCYTKIAIPFLESKPTKFQIPEERTIPFRETLDEINSFLSKLNHGQFFYIGCQTEVYLIIAPDMSDGPTLVIDGEEGIPTEHLLYFSNNYLGLHSVREEHRKSLCARSSRKPTQIPNFQGVPFVIPNIGSEQDSDNRIIYGIPTIITSDISKAIRHFRTTDFSGFEWLVKKFYFQRTIYRKLRLVTTR